MRNDESFCHLGLINSFIVFSKKNKEQRENVIGELVQTEREFCRDLKLTWSAFGLDTPEILEQSNIDVSALFGNLRDVIDTSENFLYTLQVRQSRQFVPENVLNVCVPFRRRSSQSVRPRSKWSENASWRTPRP